MELEKLGYKIIVDTEYTKQYHNEELEEFITIDKIYSTVSKHMEYNVLEFTVDEVIALGKALEEKPKFHPAEYIADFAVDEKTAKKLEDATGVSAETWLNLQRRYDE